MSITLLCAALSLASCGFTPLHGQASRTTSSGTSGERSALAVEISPIGRDRTSQQLHTRLEDLFNPLAKNRAPQYRLHLTLKEQEVPLVIEQDRSINRYNLVYTAQYQIKDNSSGAIIHKGQSKIVGSYDRVESEFATHAAKTDTRRRVIDELAHDVKTRVTAFLLNYQSTSSS